MKWWAQVLVTILLAGATAFASAMMTRSQDMERIATLEAQASSQREMNRTIDVRLIRIEDKLDRLIEGRGRRPAWGQ